VPPTKSNKADDNDNDSFDLTTTSSATAALLLADISLSDDGAASTSTSTAAAAATTSTMKTDEHCYHGSTKKDFYDPNYNNILVSIRENAENINIHLLTLQDEFFCKFMFAKAIDEFFRLGTNNEDNTDKINALCNLLFRAIMCRYSIIPESKGEATNSEKVAKYCRDIRNTKMNISCRGLINILDRETPDCNCMTSSKIKANQTLDKVSVCSGCLIGYPKEKLSLCPRCNFNKYCSQNCFAKHWPEHKKICKVLRAC
jgi:hypothetical protein